MPIEYAPEAAAQLDALEQSADDQTWDAICEPGLHFITHGRVRPTSNLAKCPLTTTASLPPKTTATSLNACVRRYVQSTSTFSFPRKPGDNSPRGPLRHRSGDRFRRGGRHFGFAGACSTSSRHNGRQRTGSTRRFQLSVSQPD